MTNNPYESPQTGGQALPRKARPILSTLIGSLTVIAVLGFLVALLLPLYRGGSREPTRRMACGNNLKQIALALENYADEYDALPPAFTVDAQGQPLHSWRTLILPYLEQQALYETIDLSKPWDDPANQAAFETSIGIYRCPSVDCPATHTTYLAIVTPGGCFLPTQPRPLADITDNRDQTLMVFEVAAEQAVPWMAPTDASASHIVNFAAGSKLAHRTGAQAVSVNGQVRFFSADLPPAKLRALISIAGDDDEVVGTQD